MVEVSLPAAMIVFISSEICFIVNIGSVSAKSNKRSTYGLNIFLVDPVETEGRVCLDFINWQQPSDASVLLLIICYVIELTSHCSLFSMIKSVFNY